MFDLGLWWTSNVVPPLFTRRRSVYGAEEDFTVVERVTKLEFLTCSYIWSEVMMDKQCGSSSFQKVKQCARSSRIFHSSWKGYKIRIQNIYVLIVVCLFWLGFILEKQCGSSSFQKEEQCARSSRRFHSSWKGYKKSTWKYK